MRSLLTLVLYFTSASIVSSSSSWEHDWATPSSAWWGYGAMGGGEIFSDTQIAFAASTYKVIVLSICMGTNTSSVANTVMSVSAKLKALNPALKVMMYWNMQQFACYNTEEPDYSTFLANPQWWLRDDSGNPVLNNKSPQYDWTNPEGVEHWLSMPIALNGVTLLDGYLLDGGAVYDPEANVNPTRAEALKNAKYAAVGRMQARLSAINGGITLANGMAGGPIDPHVNDPFNLQVLQYSNGVENERGSPAFEEVDGSTGAYKKDLIAANLAAIEEAGQAANGTKLVAINYWPGPIVGFPTHADNMSGWPVFAPQDPLNHAPNGTKQEVIQGWGKIMEQWLPFNLATFLTVAGPTTYFTQMVWYAAFQGFVPCPQAPDTCIDPQPIYASLMNKPLGPPLGARQQLDTYRWVRHFQHAVVTLDLDDPLGPGTSIVWSAP